MFKPKQAEYTPEQHKLLIKPQSAASWGTRAQYFTFFYENLAWLRAPFSK
jgi:hypothetical protein